MTDDERAVVDSHAVFGASVSSELLGFDGVHASLNVHTAIAGGVEKRLAE